MKLIFVLGNTGAEYDATRHNVGFFIADAYARSNDVSFNEKPRLKSLIANFSQNGEKVMIAKPMTFYNKVGESLSQIMNFYKFAAEDILIVHDELALPFGTLRARTGGSDAGNNGIKSINQYGGAHTHRLRIGVASERRSLIGDTNFVLGAFSVKEYRVLQQAVLPKAIEMINVFLEGSHAAVSHTLDIGEGESTKESVQLLD